MPDSQTSANLVTPPQVQRLAEVLAHAFRIAEGQGLVEILGCGDERNNVEALAGWVRAEVGALDLEVAGALLPILIRRLETRLRTREETP